MVGRIQIFDLVNESNEAFVELKCPDCQRITLHGDKQLTWYAIEVIIRDEADEKVPGVVLLEAPGFQFKNCGCKPEKKLPPQLRSVEFNRRPFLVTV